MGNNLQQRLYNISVAEKKKNFNSFLNNVIPIQFFFRKLLLLKRNSRIKKKFNA